MDRPVDILISCLEKVSSCLPGWEVSIANPQQEEHSHACGCEHQNGMRDDDEMCRVSLCASLVVLLGVLAGIRPMVRCEGDLSVMESFPVPDRSASISLFVRAAGPYQDFPMSIVRSNSRKPLTRPYSILAPYVPTQQRELGRWCPFPRHVAFTEQGKLSVASSRDNGSTDDAVISPMLMTVLG